MAKVKAALQGGQQPSELSRTPHCSLSPAFCRGWPRTRREASRSQVHPLSPDGQPHTLASPGLMKRMQVPWYHMQRFVVVALQRCNPFER